MSSIWYLYFKTTWFKVLEKLNNFFLIAPFGYFLPPSVKVSSKSLCKLFLKISTKERRICSTMNLSPQETENQNLSIFKRKKAYLLWRWWILEKKFKNEIKAYLLSTETCGWMRSAMKDSNPCSKTQYLLLIIFKMFFNLSKTQLQCWVSSFFFNHSELPKMRLHLSSTVLLALTDNDSETRKAWPRQEKSHCYLKYLSPIHKFKTYLASVEYFSSEQSWLSLLKYILRRWEDMKIVELQNAIFSKKEKQK